MSPGLAIGVAAVPGRRGGPATGDGCRRARAGSHSQRARRRAGRRERRRRAPGGRSRRATPRGVAGPRGCPGWHRQSPSDRATWTASRSPPLDRAAMRAARRMSVSPSGPPVRATTTRSRASQVPVMSCVSRYCLERVVDPVGGPQQRQLAQRVEVAGAEVVRQGGVDLLGRVDVAVGQAPPQRLGGHVLQLDLVGRADDGVRHGLALRYAGDLLDHVVDRLQVLDVDGGDDVDPGSQQLLDVLPALGVA